MQKHEVKPIVSNLTITLDEIRVYYFDRTKHTLKLEDAKYLLEIALDKGLDHSNGGIKALFSSLKYNFE